MRIESTLPAERADLLDVAISTGLFTASEAESLLGEVLDALSQSSMPSGHQAVCCRDDESNKPLGWCYFAPDDHAPEVWNLWWIGVAPAHQGTGAGKCLLEHVEQKVHAAGGRLLIIETSDASALAGARQFYATKGYSECGRVPHFYAEGESKVIFARRLRAAA